MNYIGNIAYCIPTYNRSNFIKKILKRILQDFNKYGIDIYIFDSSSDYFTEEVIKEYYSFKNLYYIKMDETVGIEKKKAIFTGSEFDKNKDYDYVWVVKDRVYPSEDIIKRILVSAESNPDVIFLRAIETYHTVDLVDEYYDDPVKFYHDWAWLVTSWDCTILNRRKILADLNWDKDMAEYINIKPDENGYLNFPIVAILFKKLSELHKCNIQVLKAEAGKHIINLPIEKNIDSSVFKVWGYNWYYANNNLPYIYNDEKEFVIKSGTSLPWIIGDQIRLMDIWQSGNLTDDKLECVKDIWNGISDVPWEDVCRIKNGDIDFMRCCFVDLVWENVAVGNMNQV